MDVCSGDCIHRAQLCDDACVDGCTDTCAENCALEQTPAPTDLEPGSGNGTNGTLRERPVPTPEQAPAPTDLEPGNGNGTNGTNGTVQQPTPEPMPTCKAVARAHASTPKVFPGVHEG